MKDIYSKTHNCILTFFVILILHPAVRSQENISLPGNRAIAVYTDQSPRIDGKVDPEWLDAPVHNGFIQREPVQGARASNDTRFYALFDQSHIYLLFVMIDNDPRSIPSYLMERDQPFNPNDNICFYLDTYNDQRKAYFFSTNPAGIEQDGLISENGDNIDYTWDGIFKVAAKINDYGWVAEFAIPYKSLRFNDDNKYQVWGFNAWRIRKKNREISYWSLVDQNYQMIRLDKGGVLIGMRQISSGHSLNLLPYVTTRNIESFSAPAESDFDGGLDIKYGLTSDLWLDATLNPDFGQVEIDEEQINLDKRYEIQIEEKRPFFLENTNLFQMPFYQLFYSRRIGFESEIKAGAKVTGKIGKYSLGILEAFTGGWENFGTGDPGKPPTDELFSVFRLQRDIFSSSNLGMMYVNRAANIGSENPEYNHALDLDYSIYSGQKYFMGQGVYTHNTESGATQKGGGVFGQAGYYGRLFWFNVHATSFTEDFNLDHTGFFPKIQNKGSTQAGFYADVHPLISKKIVRSWGFSIQPTAIKDTDESEAGWGVKSTAWLEFPEQSRLKIGYTRYRDVEADNFSNFFGGVKGTELPYSGRDIFAEIQTDIGKPVSVHLRWNDDSQYYFQTHNTGYSTGLEGSVRIKPLPSTRMELGVQNRKFLNDNRELMPTSLVGQSNILILSLRARYLFSRYIFSRLFVQHTNGAEDFQSMNNRVVFPLRYEVWDRLSANVLLGWRFSMGSTLYLAYTEEWEKRFTVNFKSSNRILYLKISYLWSI